MTRADFYLRYIPRILSALRRHLHSNEVTASEYRARKRHDLRNRLLGQTRILVDTSHWIRLRDVELGKSTDAIYSEILGRLRKLAALDLVVCPLTDQLAEEILRQTDLRTRVATTTLVDDLGRGAALMGMTARQPLETRHWVSSLYDEAQEPLTMSVWTLVPFIANEWTIKPPVNEAHLSAALKAFEDIVHDVRFSDLQDELDLGEPSPGWSNVARRLTLNKSTVWKDQGPFPEVFVDEALGYWDSIWPDVYPLLESVFQRLPRGAALEGEALKENTKRCVVASIECGILRNHLPTMQILAAGNARIRTDSRRQFKHGDPGDLLHATTALPYCHAFLTDRPMRHLLATKPTLLAQQFSCHVLSDPHDILRFIETLEADGRSGAP